MIQYSKWKYRVLDGGDEEFSTIRFWSYMGVKTDFRDHENAATQVARNLTGDDPDYYSILEMDGREVEIMSPEGEVRLMRIGGYTDFTYTAEEIGPVEPA